MDNIYKCNFYYHIDIPIVMFFMTNYSNKMQGCIIREISIFKPNKRVHDDNDSNIVVLVIYKTYIYKINI